MNRLYRIPSLLRAHPIKMLFSFALVFALLTAGCLVEPERNNPADPSSPSYDSDGILRIQVVDRNDRPLEGAIIRLLGYDDAQFTNLDGITEFEVPGDTVYYSVEREEYVPQTSQIVIQPRKTSAVEVKLNGRPHIDSVSVITTLVEELRDPTNIYTYGYEFTVHCGDYDAITDLTELKIYAPDVVLPTTLPTSKTIKFAGEAGESPDDLLDLLGRDFRFVLFDELFDTAEVNARIYTYLNYRYLYEDMSQVLPRDYVIGNMEFTWENNTSTFLGYYPDTYRLRIFEDDDDNEPPFVDTTVVFDDPSQVKLSLTIYQTEGFQLGFPRWWEITMYDRFGNWTRSPKKQFTPTKIAEE